MLTFFNCRRSSTIEKKISPHLSTFFFVILPSQGAHGLHMDGIEHVTPLTHFNSSQMAQISPPQPIFISTEGRPNQMELLHRTARRITAARRNFTRFHWSPTHAPPHPHARHPIQAQIPHQTPLPLQTASAYSGILLNFL